MFAKLSRGFVAPVLMAVKRQPLPWRRAFSEVYSPVPANGVASRLYDVLMNGSDSELCQLLETKDIDPDLRFEVGSHPSCCQHAADPADPDALRVQGNCTPLMIAAENNKVDMVKDLIEHGANLNLQDDLGKLPLPLLLAS